MDDLAKAYLADLRIQAAHDVRYLRYWVDDPGGRVFCLVEAPSAEAAAGVHRKPTARSSTTSTGSRRLVGRGEGRCEPPAWRGSTASPRS
jgi:hypothetical protein